MLIIFLLKLHEYRGPKGYGMGTSKGSKVEGLFSKVRHRARLKMAQQTGRGLRAETRWTQPMESS